MRRFLVIYNLANVFCSPSWNYLIKRELHCHLGTMESGQIQSSLQRLLYSVVFAIDCTLFQGTTNWDGSKTQKTCFISLTIRHFWLDFLCRFFVRKRVWFLRGYIANATKPLSFDPSNYQMNPWLVARLAMQIYNPRPLSRRHSNRWHSGLHAHSDQ